MALVVQAPSRLAITRGQMQGARCLDDFCAQKIARAKKGATARHRKRRQAVVVVVVVVVALRRDVDADVPSS